MLWHSNLSRAREQGLKMWKMYQHFPPSPNRHVHFTPTATTGTINLSQTLPAHPQVFHISLATPCQLAFPLKPRLHPGPEAFHRVKLQAFLQWLFYCQPLS